MHSSSVHLYYTLNTPQPHRHFNSLMLCGHSYQWEHWGHVYFLWMFSGYLFILCIWKWSTTVAVEGDVYLDIWSLQGAGGIRSRKYTICQGGPAQTTPKSPCKTPYFALKVLLLQRYPGAFAGELPTVFCLPCSPSWHWKGCSSLWIWMNGWKLWLMSFPKTIFSVSILP